MNQRYTNRDKYFHELAETSRNYYIDYVGRFLPIKPGLRVLEVGCGEGGNLLPFAEMGCDVEGIDFSGGKINAANRIFLEHKLNGRFACEDFFDATVPEHKYDLVLVHDVFEHIAQSRKVEFLCRLKHFTTPKGIVFLAFPAWQMPFGGHQQTCRNRFLSVLPWIHLLPMKMYRGLLRMFREPEDHIRELMDIRASKVTVERFEQVCKAAGCEVLDRALWLINPHYRVKFGMIPIRLRFGLDLIPWLRNYLSSSCFYVIH